ncbi:neutral/alkaline non-lysosomal ceramidase N-terminal domain-containing protein [Pontibacter silvestris]|uniref:Neutral ceramidase n=1 Tax=Pontibacter silvestris TaxID=2305183 RepID=A0ABW4WSD9_9BACT|nr:neutral/alkaline non-lysosomal ceramidase N-terminal domain-containing protein [Pontibacter silvestris]MCC9137860.1 neutral/alkaline non-lysosomal ceramidase N-terminal domain-containing protein [Pontibacter silvestris]
MLLFFQSCIVQPIDTTPPEQTDYYRKTVAQIEQAKLDTTAGDTLKIGWAKVNITPPPPAPLAGYGKRLGLKYKEVHDSAYVRTFAFDNGQHLAFLVTLDMLITPMELTKVLEKQYSKLGLKPQQVYLTATHTHTSFGGWGKRIGGRMMAGKYKKKLVQQAAEHVLQSINQAQANLEATRVGYGYANGAPWVYNRLTGSATARDTTIRFLKFEKKNGNTAILCTFSAHPTILPSMQPVLSRDYPGVLVDQLEKQVNFAAFAAGAVSSHRSNYQHGETFKSVEEIGHALAEIVLQESATVQLTYTNQLNSVRIPLSLPKPHWRLGDEHRFAPGLFYTFFGKYSAYLSSLQVGETVLLGTPADYSGEFMTQLEQQAHKQGQHMVLTGFNGGYIGYIVPDEHYQLKKYEARAMNFYGPYSGSYLTQMLLQLLRLHQ